MTSPASTSSLPDSILLPSLAVLGGQISVNLGAAIAKNLFPVIGVEGITAYRVGFSALILLAIFRPQGLLPPRRTIRAKKTDEKLEALEEGTTSA